MVTVAGPFKVTVGTGGGGAFSSNWAVTLLAAVTLVSVRGLAVEPSLQLTKRALAAATAKTMVPLAPWVTVCGVVPEITP